MRKLTYAIFLMFPAAMAFGAVSMTVEGGRSGLSSNSVIDISHDASSIWLGTGTGAAITTDGGQTWTTYGQDGGLPGDEVSALTANNRGVWVANSHTEEISGDNIPYGDSISFSSDGGMNWQSFGPKQVNWPGMLSYDLAVYDSIVFSACFYGGLIRSTDLGQSWENLFPSQLNDINSDSVDYHGNIFNSINNRMFSVEVDTADFPDIFSVWAGSAGGINRFIFNSWNEYGWHRYPLNDTNSAARVSGESSTQGNHDWLISSGMDFTGATACTLSFNQHYADMTPGLADFALVMLSYDDGINWPDTVVQFADSTLGNPDSFDQQIIDISAFAAGQASVTIAFKYVKNVMLAAGSWTVDSILVVADSVILLTEDFEGAWGRLGDVPPVGWTIIDNDRTPGIFNTYPDSIVHIFHADTTVEDTLRLPGDFVVSLGVNKVGSVKTVWAACRPAFSGYMRVAYSQDNGLNWHEAPIGGFFNSVEAWDFSFAGDTVYVATNNGLFRSTGDYSSWTMLSDFVDSQNQTYYQHDAPFYAVNVAGGAVWAGGSEGVVKSTVTGGWEIYRSQIDANDHYAYPSPFSPFHSPRKGTTIHFRPDADSRATVTIYDLNLEKVKIVASGVPRAGGVESDDIVWDGSDDKNKLVANGVYFYRVELDTGDDLWGKIMVIK
ncbi:MAG: hypothetical protein V3W18_14580 [candidate division Zixibacteria bacterium]